MDLFGGEAEFKKIYPSHISRYLKESCLTVIIYAKSSIISHSLSIMGQKRVLAEEI